jgi:hypothetical protein
MKTAVPCGLSAKSLSLLTIATTMAIFLDPNAFAGRSESAISITDASRADSPVAIVGTVLAKEEDSGLLRYSFRTNASLTNESQKPILAFVIRIATTSANKMDLDNTRNDDYFFAEPFEPNTTVKLAQSDGPFGKSKAEVEALPSQPGAVASVKFVQFTDGSIWGDPAAGQDVLKERRLTRDELGSLGNSYRTRGEQGFVEELKKPSQLNLIVYLQQLYDSNGKDTTSVIEKLTSMIEYADRHQRDMQRQEAAR